MILGGDLSIKTTELLACAISDASLPATSKIDSDFGLIVICSTPFGFPVNSRFRMKTVSPPTVVWPEVFSTLVTTAAVAVPPFGTNEISKSSFSIPPVPLTVLYIPSLKVRVINVLSWLIAEETILGGIPSILICLLKLSEFSDPAVGRLVE